MKLLTKNQAKTVASILLFEKEDPKQFLVTYLEYLDRSFLSQILQKRIDVFELPRLDPSAIIILSILCDNPGKVILGLIETLENAKDMKLEKIDVYPLGFYEDDEFEKQFELRRKDKTYRFNFIIDG
jgi:hypothetical protein